MNLLWICYVKPLYAIMGHYYENFFYMILSILQKESKMSNFPIDSVGSLYKCSTYVIDCFIIQCVSVLHALLIIILKYMR